MAGSVEGPPSMARELSRMQRQLREVQTTAGKASGRVVALPAIEFPVYDSVVDGQFYSPLTMWTPAVTSVYSLYLFMSVTYALPFGVYARVEWHLDPWSQAELDANATMSPRHPPAYLAAVATLGRIGLAQRYGVTPGATIGGTAVSDGLTFTTSDSLTPPTASVQFRGAFPNQPEDSFVRLALAGEYTYASGEPLSVSTNVLMAVASCDGRA